MRRCRRSAGPWTVLAGGTDFYPARVGRAIDEDVLDISGDRRAARHHGRTRDGWRLGATTTWSELLEADLPPLFDGLKQAAREVGGRQIQNAGTLAGNLCNASPAADGVPPLLALDAEVELAGRAGTRRLPLASFITGNRRTVLRAGRAAGRHPCSQAGAPGAQRLPQARRAALSRDLHRHGGGHARDRRRPDRRGAHRGRRLLGGGAAPAGARSGACRRAGRSAPGRPASTPRSSRRWRRSTTCAAARPIGAMRVVTLLRRLLGGLRAVKVAFTLNGQAGRLGRSAGHAPGRRAARRSRPDRHQGRLRRRRLRRLHGAARRPAGLLLPGGDGPGRRPHASRRSRAWPTATARSRRCSRPFSTTARRSAASARPAC